MKKLLYIILGLLIVTGFASCHKDPPVVNYDASLLYGKWQEGTVFEHYYSSPIERVLPNGDTVNVNGTTWDEADDVNEDEAQLFNWTLTGATLKQEPISTFVMVPKLYTITELGANKLVYNDAYGVTHRFSKVE